MASVLSAGTTSNTALNLSADTTGVLQFQTNGTTAAMTINTSQQVGIGLTNPSAILHISSASQPYLKILYAAQREYALTVTGSTTSDGLAIRDESGSLEIARFCRGGNVGIGTSSPLTNFHVMVSDVAAYTSVQNSGILLERSGGTAALNIATDSNQSGAIWFADADAAAQGQIVYTHSSDAMYFGTNGTERMRITSAGDLVVGDTTSGGYAISARRVNDNCLMRLTAVTSGGAGIDLVNAGGSEVSYINAGGSNVLVARTGGTERMRITSGGYLKVSNDGTYTNVSDSFHEVNQSANNHAWYIRANNASQTLDACQISTARNTTNNSYYALAYYNGGAGAYKFRVADSGNCTNTNGSYGTISDIKNKENIVDATPKLDKVNQLKVRNYNFIGDDLKQIGFVAQEFEEVFPSMVEEHPDKDAEGNDLGTTTKSIKTSVLIPILVKAIQEQQAMIETLQAEVAALKGVN